MSHPIVPTINMSSEINDETNDTTSSATLNPVMIDPNQLKKIQFAEKEKVRRSLGNKRYREKKKIYLIYLWQKETKIYRKELMRLPLHFTN